MHVKDARREDVKAMMDRDLVRSLEQLTLPGFEVTLRGTKVLVRPAGKRGKNSSPATGEGGSPVLPA